MTYILLLVTAVYLGDHLTGIEFADKPSCEAAAAWFRESGRFKMQATCLPKGKMEVQPGAD